MNRRRHLIAAAVAATLVVAPLSVGAAAAPGTHPTLFGIDLCIPILLPCPEPKPPTVPVPNPSTPTTPSQPPTVPTQPKPPTVPELPTTPEAPAEPGAPASPSGPAVPAPAAPAAPATPATPGSPATSEGQQNDTHPPAEMTQASTEVEDAAPRPLGGPGRGDVTGRNAQRVSAPFDRGAPMFAGISTILRARTLSFAGVQAIELVTVATSDGQRVRVLKITADALAITGFVLTVRPSEGPVLETTADAVTFDGGVILYASTITGMSPDGGELTLGTEALPTQEAIAERLRNVDMELVGMTADSISSESPQQRVLESRPR
ncbi:MAG: hypothetical protein WAK00_08220 [Microbacterium sp.]|uniref:hypothetical protein n=1 Tax=Microbacterium sp. TaxID=51671 RepID=UPI003BAF8D24